jgi:hypothetical protein
VKPAAELTEVKHKRQTPAAQSTEAAILLRNDRLQCLSVEDPPLPQNRNVRRDDNFPAETEILND